MKNFVPIALAPLLALLGDVEANFFERELKKTKSNKKSKKQSKKSDKKSTTDNVVKSQSFTGYWNGHDLEDGTNQKLSIFCDNGFCDISLIDSSFSTCFPIVGGVFGAVAIATNVPQDSLDNFELSLYCAEQGEWEINFNKNPTAILRGDFIFLPDGGLFREGPGITYYKRSGPDINDEDSEVPSNGNDKVVGINGRYVGSDVEDGTSQQLNVHCDSNDICEVTLGDTRFSTCRTINDGEFYKGVGVAKNIPLDSMGDFDIDLYCLGNNEVQFDVNDPTRQPDAVLTGNLVSIQDGGRILRRTGSGITYYKSWFKGGIAGDFSRKLFGLDTEDGSNQVFTLTCTGGLCNATLQDASFSTCISNIPGDIFLGGIALARNVPQDSLDNYTLDLYCVEDFRQLPDGIDYDSGPITTLDGSLVFLQEGIVRRTGTNFLYYDTFYEKGPDESGKIANGRYVGEKIFDGSQEEVISTCADGSCEVSLYNTIFTECITPTGNPYFNGLGLARNVPEDSLDNFDVGVYCFGLGETVNYDVDQPTYMIKGVGLVPVDPPGAILRTETDPSTVFYRVSAE